MEYMNKFISVTDVSKILDISREAVNSWLVKDYIKYSIIGNLRKIRPGDLLQYLKNLGNSEIEMIDFKKDIDNYLKQKYGN